MSARPGRVLMSTVFALVAQPAMSAETVAPQPATAPTTATVAMPATVPQPATVAVLATAIGLELDAAALLDDVAFRNRGTWIVPLSVEWLTADALSYFVNVDVSRTDLTAAGLQHLESSSHADPAFVIHGYTVTAAPGLRDYLNGTGVSSWFGEARLGLSANKETWIYHGSEVTSSAVRLLPTVGAGYRFVCPAGLEIRLSGDLEYSTAVKQTTASDDPLARAKVKDQAKGRVVPSLGLGVGVVW